MLKRELEANKVFPTLWPNRFYTSPVKRCVSTTVAIINAGRNDEPDCPVPNVIVVDNFREWLGWNHNEQNDTRGTKTEIQKHSESLAVQPTFLHPFPEEDEMFKRNPLEEAWVDVDERWEEALNTIFDTDSSRVICICGNNRSIQSCLRLIGHRADNEVLKRSFGLANMANGAMMALLVRRVELDSAQAEERRRERRRWRKVEVDIIEQKKSADDDVAEQQVKNYGEAEIDKLLELLGQEQLDEVHAIRGQLQELP